MEHQLPGAGQLDPKRIDADPQLELELAVCAEYRIFHSEFLERSTADRDKALWWHARQRKTCQGCGTRGEEWDPEQGGHRRAYISTITTCEGCVVIERTQDAPQMKDGRGKRAGLIRNPDLQ